MDVSPDDLISDVIYQIAALDGMAKAAGGRVSYVKPHGALYNRIAVDEAQLLR
jgi:5-oxoprolinase (ATP-hydrolysing) subunit A